MRKVLFLLLCALPVRAATVFVSQSGGSVSCGADGTQSTISIATANSSMAAPNIYAGCGVFSTALSFPNSGSAGNLITFLFENNADFSAAHWPSATGAINLNGKSFILIDGNNHAGIIENTANGTGLANQVNSTGIQANGSHDIEIRGLTIRNLYVHTLATDITVDAQQVNCIQYQGSNVLIHDNTFNDVGWCLYQNYTADSGVQIYNNTFTNYAHGIVCAGANFIQSDIRIHDNIFGSMANWNTNVDQYHLAGIHCYNGSGGKTQNAYIYNNSFNGSFGTCCITGWIFLEGGTGGGATPWTDATGTAYLWNNIFIANIDVPNGLVTVSRGTNHVIYNNTFVGPNAGNNGVCLELATGPTNLIIENNVIEGCTQFIKAVDAGSTFATIDYNSYANTAGGNPFWQFLTHTGSTLASWQSACSCDSHSFANVGSVNTSGTAVTYSSGQNFSQVGAGPIVINGTAFTISTVNSNTSITLTTSAGTLTNQPYSAPLKNFSQSTGLPTSALSQVIGAGLNLSSLATGNLATLQSDTTLGNTRSPNTRPPLGLIPWATGASEFSSGGGGGGGSGSTLFSGRAILSGLSTVTTSGTSAVAITSSASLPGCTVGVLCSDTLTATGGAGGYVWSLFSGAFPTNSNFTLSAGGVLSGVPSAASTCSGCMTIQVCDSTLVNCATQAFSITISAGSLAFVNNALPDGTQSAVYSATALVTGGTLPYTSCSVFSGSLPTGLSVTVTGSGLLAGCLISGTVGGSAVGASFVLSVTDTASTTVHSATLSISISVAGACGFPFFPCGNISTTINPLAQAANTNPSCFDSPGAANCKQPVPQLGFAGVLGQLTITTPGTCSVHPTLSFSGGTFTRAGAATAVWSSTNSLVGLTYSDYGAYTVAPSVAFSGGTCSTAPVATVALQSVSCNGHQCQGGLFGANSVVNGYSGAIVSNDPFYGSGRVLRLTDALIDPSNPYKSCFTDSSAENAQTNYDGTIIKASCGAWSDLFSLDYSIWNSGACAIGSTTCNAFKLQLVGKGGNFPGSFIFGQSNATPALPADQTSDTYAFYAFDNCAAGGLSTCAKIERWLICGPAGNTSTLCPGGWDAVVDPNWPTTGSGGYDVTQANCAGSTYMTGSVLGQGLFTPWASFGNSAMNASDNRFAVELRVFSGLQDEGGTSVTVDTSVAGAPRCKVLDLSRGTASTDWNNSAPVAITSAVCSGSSCTQVFNTLLPPAMPTLH